MVCRPPNPIETVLVYGGHPFGSAFKGLYGSSLSKDLAMLHKLAEHIRRPWDIEVVYGGSLEKRLSLISPKRTLIVIPPGPSSELDAVFSREEVESITNAIYNGARLLATCGSAYWVAQRRFWNPLGIDGSPKEGLIPHFPVTAVGPLFPQPHQPVGMAFEFKAVPLTLAGKTVMVLSGGGGCFSYDDDPRIKPLGAYGEKALEESTNRLKSPHAIVLARHGEGGALLSMVHLDTGEKDLSSLKAILAALKDRRDNIDQVCRTLSPEEDRFEAFSYLIGQLEEAAP